MRSAFDLPKMRMTKVENLIKLEEVFKLIKQAKNVMAFFRDEKGEFRFLYTDIGEDEFLMMSILMHRHIEVYNFFKLAIIDIEKNRQIPCEEHDFTYKALEYIKLGKLAHLNI